MNRSTLSAQPAAPAAPNTKTPRTFADAAENLVRKIKSAGTLHARYLGTPYLWDCESGRLYQLDKIEDIANLVHRHGLLPYSKFRFWQILELAAEKLRQDCAPMDADFAAFMCCQGPGMDGTPVTRAQIAPWLSAAFKVWFNF